MNLLKTFESRVSDAFGAAPQGNTTPFSFKKLAKACARAMEDETLSVDGVETAPALFTIFVAPDDGASLRPIYANICREVTSFIEAQANSKGYVFVGKPLTRFINNPHLRSGRFDVRAENVNGLTLSQLRAEEEGFIARLTGQGGGAYSPAAAAAAQPMRPIQPIQEQPLPVASASFDQSPSAGLDVLPDVVVDEALQQAPVAAAVPAAIPVPQTQRRETFSVPQPQQPQVAAPVAAPTAACALVDHQNGITFRAEAPTCPLGRERVSNGIVIRDPNVSRRHAELTYDGANWSIVDLGSTNGTQVNDVDVDSRVLRTGDIITLGLTNLEFREI